MGRVNTRQRVVAPAFSQNRRMITPYKARDRPVSDFLRKPGQCPIRRKGCHGKGIAVAFLQIFGGSKIKRDKGGMPDEPGHRQITPPGNAGRAFRGCYDFGIMLPKVCGIGKYRGAATLLP